MLRFVFLAAIPCLLAAQTGRYYFLEFTTADSPKGREVAAAGGTLNLAPTGCTAEARVARNQEAAKPAAPKLSCKLDDPAHLTIDSPSGLGGPLRVVAGEGNKLLIASGSKPGSHAFLAAFAVPATPASPAPIPSQGLYRAAWFQAQPLVPRGLTSGFLSFSFTPRRIDEQASLINHSTEFDDVARLMSMPLPKLEVTPAGTGTIAFAPTDLNIPLRGSREIMFSPDGAFFFAWSTTAGPRDVMIGLRADPDASSYSWMGSFAIAETYATVPYEMNSRPAILNSALGAARNSGGGFLELEQNLWDGKSSTALTTRNAYRIGTDGSSMLGPALRPNETNLAIGGNPVAFLGAHVGPLNELSLNHGIFFGIRLSQQVPPAPAPLAVTHADGSAVDSSKPARVGEAIAIALPNLKPGPVRVLVDGIEAQGKAGSPLTITVPKTKRFGNLPLTVCATGVVHDITDLPVQP
ncbi:MAG TPA: hypothetical protein VFB63_07995 [Bryobacteraceae bacterium]|nr:hypothetical protein [Bryobacteraceae bacterium]